MIRKNFSLKNALIVFLSTRFPSGCLLACKSVSTRQLCRRHLDPQIDNWSETFCIIYRYISPWLVPTERCWSGIVRWKKVKHHSILQRSSEYKHSASARTVYCGLKLPHMQRLISLIQLPYPTNSQT